MSQTSQLADSNLQSSIAQHRGFYPVRTLLLLQLVVWMLLIPGCGNEPGAEPLLRQEIATKIQTWLAHRPDVQPKRALFPLETASELSQSLEHHSKAGKLPGSVVAIASSNQTWIQATGASDLAQKIALQPNDRFRLGNLSELFEAVVCLQLVEEETLSLKDSLTDWLPAEILRSIPNADKIADKITVRQLLNHTSALPDLDMTAFQQAVKANPSHRWQPAELLPFMTRPASRGRGSFNYSRLNYLLLELIIERATAGTLAEAIQTRIVQPLELRNTYVELSATQTIAHGYQDWNGDGSREDVTQPLINTGLGLGGQAMISNAPDLIQFFRALFQQDKLLTPTARQQMLTLVEMRKGGYCLGIVNSLTRWGEAWGQTDDTATGFSSAVVYLPVHDLVLVAWTNTANAADQSTDLIESSLEIVLGNLSKIPTGATVQW